MSEQQMVLQDKHSQHATSNGTDVEEQAVKYLTFKIEDDVYGSEIDKIKEIIEYGSITRVPLTPDYLRGVINLRGNVVPVVDLAKRIGKNSKGVNKKTCIIIVEMSSDIDDEAMDIGFVVDEVDEVMDIPDHQVAPAPQFGTDIRSEFIAGMGKTHSQFVILLQLNEVLSVKELAELVEIESNKY